MKSIQRRTILLQVAGAGIGLLALNSTAAAAGPKLEESDPVATGLGYREDSAKVDAKKFPKHAPTQTCAGCQLFQGGPKDALGGCPLFAGKQVAAGGWCSAWNKKA